MNALDLAENVDVRTVHVQPGACAPGLVASMSADVFDGLGYDPIFMESVGMGRAQVDIIRRVHTVILFVPSDLGDPGELAASGLLEFADLVVVNKCDREGALEFADSLELELRERRAEGDLRPARVFRTQAINGTGIEELLDALGAHAAEIRRTGVFVERSRAQTGEQLRHLLFAVLEAQWQSDVGLRALLDDRAASILAGSSSVVETAHEIAAEIAAPRR